MSESVEIKAPTTKDVQLDGLVRTRVLSLVAVNTLLLQPFLMHSKTDHCVIMYDAGVAHMLMYILIFMATTADVFSCTHL